MGGLIVQDSTREVVQVLHLKALEESPSSKAIWQLLHY